MTITAGGGGGQVSHHYVVHLDLIFHCALTRWHLRENLKGHRRGSVCLRLRS